jgi:hypothetical protein
MTEPADSLGIRIGTAEREAALKALADHMSAGRLDPDEYGDRVALASGARFAGELEPLFADLPGGPVTRPMATRPALPPAAAGEAPSKVSEREALGGRAGATLVAVSPFIALGLFFGLAALGWDYSWLAFLLIPAAGAIVYGSSGSGRSGYGRNRQRNR